MDARHLETENVILEDEEMILEDEVTQEYELGDVPEDDDDDMEVDDAEADVTAEIVDDARSVFRGHTGPVYAISIHPLDKNIVLSGGGDDVGLIWSMEDNSIKHVLKGHTDSVVAVGFSFDGVLAATGGYDGIVKIWNVQTGALLHTLDGPSQEIEWIKWHSKGNVVLAGSGDGTAWMWLAATGECMHVFAGHEDSVTCGSFSGSGKMIVTGSSDCTVRLWNPKTGECSFVFRGQEFHEGPICNVICHPKQPVMISCSQDGTARLLHIQNKRQLAAFSHAVNEASSGTVAEDDSMAVNSVECAGFCNTLNWCATADLGGELRIWDLASYQCRHICRHEAGVIKLMWHPTEPFVYTCTVDGMIHVWDARNGQLQRSLSGHSEMILDMDLIVRNGFLTELVTASDDETVRIFGLN
ncbi:angio-associated migratory cell protein [Thraustotheca clavata]|uniref:Angio-associated migratory cell protein n=1 Tax=Thraustotheca clavata TaxID=74557 RepID=A0A1W0A5R4_9STRA|nr:angio-associated migratory cell protein [Thraustotheca clavata]